MFTEHRHNMAKCMSSWLKNSETQEGSFAPIINQFLSNSRTLPKHFWALTPPSPKRWRSFGLSGDWEVIGFYFWKCGAILGKYYIDDITSHHNHDNITTTAWRWQTPWRWPTRWPTPWPPGCPWAVSHSQSRLLSVRRRFLAPSVADPQPGNHWSSLLFRDFIDIDHLHNQHDHHNQSDHHDSHDHLFHNMTNMSTVTTMTPITTVTTMTSLITLRLSSSSCLLRWRISILSKIGWTFRIRLSLNYGQFVRSTF